MLFFLPKLAREKIHIGETHYRHSVTPFPLSRTVTWDADEIASVFIGHYRTPKPRYLNWLPANPRPESAVSLIVLQRNGKQDRIGFELRDDRKHFIFLEIQKAANNLGHNWQFIDEIEDWVYETYPKDD